MKNSLIYSLCAASVLVWGCAQEVEPITFEAPQVEYTLQEEALSLNVGEPKTFEAKILKGDGLTLAWYVDEVLEASSASFTYTWSKPGDYVVRFEASNGSGSQTKSYKVSVNDKLEIFISSEANYEVGTSTDCLELDYIRVCAVVVKGSNVSHEWSVDGVKQDCTSAIFNTYQTPAGKGTHVVSYKGSNSVGSVTKEFTVNVLERPLTVEYSVDANTIVVAKGGSQEFKAEIKYGGTGATYNWYVNDKLAGNEATYTFSADAVGEYTVKFSSQNAKGEKADHSWIIIVPARTEVLLEDYEDGKGRGVFVQQSGAKLSVVDNPKPDEVNGSAKCLKATGSGSGYFGCMKSAVQAVGYNWCDYTGMKVDLYIENSKGVGFCPCIDKKLSSWSVGYIWAPKEEYKYDQWITIDYDLQFGSFTGTQIQPRPFLVHKSNSGKGNNVDAVYYDNIYLYK